MKLARQLKRDHFPDRPGLLELIAQGLEPGNTPSVHCDLVMGLPDRRLEIIEE